MYVYLYLTIYTHYFIIKILLKRSYISVFKKKFPETLGKSLISPIFINTPVYEENLFIIT